MSYRSVQERARQETIVVDLHTDYPIITRILRDHFSFKLNDTSTNDWDLYWMDLGVTPDFVTKLKPHQKVNHFPNMSCLHRKNQLARNLSKMYRKFGADYGFFPQTWILPGDWNWLRIDASRGESKTFIVKPEGLSQGKGIYLVKDVEEISPFDHCVVQRYVGNPYLIDGLKFDLRMYVLVYGCDPLRIYVFKEGLARFSTEEYIKPTQHNLQNQYIHLTNYAINKFSKKFVFNADADNPTVGHKRSLAFIWDYVDRHGGNSFLLRSNINDIIVKTFCAVQPQLSRCFRACQPANLNNNMCFEILGIDILIDDTLKPWLLEVNHAPSFSVDTPFDEKVKTELLVDTFTLVRITPESRRRCLERERERQNARIFGKGLYALTREEKEKIWREGMVERDNYEMEHCGGFTRIYPSSVNNGKYKTYIDYADMMMNRFCGLKTNCVNVTPVASTVRVTRPKSPVAKTIRPRKKIVVKTRAQELDQMRLNVIASIYNSKSCQIKANRNPRILIALRDYFPYISKFPAVKTLYRRSTQKSSNNIIGANSTTARFYDTTKPIKRENNIKDSLSTRQTFRE